MATWPDFDTQTSHIRQAKRRPTMTYLTSLALPLLFLLDYLAIIYWLMRTANQPALALRFSMRTLLIAMTLAAIHLGVISAFLSFQANS